MKFEMLDSGRVRVTRRRGWPWRRYTETVVLRPALCNGGMGWFYPNGECAGVGEFPPWSLGPQINVWLRERKGPQWERLP